MGSHTTTRAPATRGRCRSNNNKKKKNSNNSSNNDNNDDDDNNMKNMFNDMFINKKKKKSTNCNNGNSNDSNNSSNDNKNNNDNSSAPAMRGGCGPPADTGATANLHALLRFGISDFGGFDLSDILTTKISDFGHGPYTTKILDFTSTSYYHQGKIDYYQLL